MISTENVQRQVAIALVIPVEEPPLLFAVQRQIGGIHVQDDLCRSLCRDSMNTFTSSSSNASFQNVIFLLAECRMGSPSALIRREHEEMIA